MTSNFMSIFVISIKTMILHKYKFQFMSDAELHLGGDFHTEKNIPERGERERQVAVPASIDTPPGCYAF